MLVGVRTPACRRVRIQIILTIALITANLVGIAWLLLKKMSLLPPSIVSDALLVDHARGRTRLYGHRDGVGQLHVKVDLGCGATASEEHTPSADQRNTLLGLSLRWRSTLILWAVGGACLPLLYGLANRLFPSRRSCSRHCLWRSVATPATCSPSLPAPGGRSGTSGGAGATADGACTGNHRPDHGGVAAQLRACRFSVSPARGS